MQNSINKKLKTESSKNSQIALVGSTIATIFVYYLILDPFIQSAWKYVIAIILFFVGVGWLSNSLNKDSAYKKLADIKIDTKINKNDNALSLLDKRYTKGEITKKQYLEIKSEFKKKK